MSNRSEDHQQYYVRITALTPRQYAAQVAKRGRNMGDAAIGSWTEAKRTTDALNSVIGHTYRDPFQISQRTKGATS